MKRSLIIIFIICFALGQSFSIIIKEDKKAQGTTKICCTKQQSQPEKIRKTPSTDQSVLPVVNLIPYSL